MLFLEDGQTADPALWGDWIDCLNHDEFITPIQAFGSAHLFLKNYYENSSSNAIKRVLEDTEISNEGLPVHQEVWTHWLNCINETASKQKKDNMLTLS